MRFYFFFLLSSLLLTVTKLAFAEIPVYNKTQTEITVTKENPYFTIAFEFDPSFGADWNLHAYNSEQLTLIKYDFKPYSNEPRAKGIISWTFKTFPDAIKANHPAPIVIQYGFHWETRSEGETLRYLISTKLSLSP